MKAPTPNAPKVATASSILKVIGMADLLSGDGGKISFSPSLRRKVAIYSNGVAVVAQGYEWDSEVRMALTNAKQRGHVTTQQYSLPQSDLIELYGSSSEAKARQPLELDRQVDVADILRGAAAEGANDIHMRVLEKHTEIRIRVFGRLKDFAFRDTAEGDALIKAIFAVADDITGNSSGRVSQQGKLSQKSGLLPPKVEMVRLQYVPTSSDRGALVMRLAYESPKGEIEIDHLGYNPRQIGDIATMRKRTNGMYVLAGKVSSGKTTTAQRTLNKMIQEKQREISMFTIEEPVELDLPNAIQVPVKGVEGFIQALKDSLRSDPNVIVLGEVRTSETSALAMQLVQTGHALWTTIHAGSALGILDRLLDLKVPLWQLRQSGSVRGLVYQRLCGTMCKHCRKTYRDGVADGSLEKDLAQKLVSLFQKSPDELYVRGPGCEKCKMGLSGRTVVAETILTDPKLLEFFANGDRIGMMNYWLTPTADGGMGGAPVLHHALAKVGAGICDINEVEEEVDLFSEYETHFMHLSDRLRADVLYEAETDKKKAAKKAA